MGSLVIPERRYGRPPVGRCPVPIPDSVSNPFEKVTTMRKNLSIGLTLLALLGVAPLLGACHTTAGAGKDISAAGHAITGSAEKHTP